MLRWRKGFTLLELVLVIAVIAILAAIIAPRFTTQIPKARVSQSRANLENLRTAVGLYQAEVGSYPQALWNLMPNYIRQIPGETLSNPNGRPNSTVSSTTSGTGGWFYNSTSGEVRCNVQSYRLPDNTMEYPLWNW